MRRLRLEGLLADARGKTDEGLTFTQEALDIAERYGYRRYRYNLLSDRAWMQLQSGHPQVAEGSLLELLSRIPPGPHDGLPRAEALAALLAARTAAGRLDSARSSVADVVQALQICGLFFHRGDIFAWLAAAVGEPRVAAKVLGAMDEFHARTEAPRDRLAARAREEALRILKDCASEIEQRLWMSQGQRLVESQLIACLRTTFGSGDRPSLPQLGEP